MIKKIFHFLIISLIVFTNLFAVYFLYLLFIPFKPIEFFNSPFPVITKQVKRGENVIYTAHHCKYVDTGALVTRSLVNDIQYALPEVHSTVPKGCNTLNIMSVRIPEVIPPGKYHIHINLTYNLNPFRIYQTSVETQEFEVI